MSDALERARARAAWVKDADRILAKLPTDDPVIMALWLVEWNIYADGIPLDLIREGGEDNLRMAERAALAYLEQGAP